MICGRQAWSLMVLVASHLVSDATTNDRQLALEALCSMIHDISQHL